MFSSPKTTPAPETAPGRACVGACVLRATCSDRRPCAHGGGIGDRRVGKRADNRPDAERNIGCNTGVGSLPTLRNTREMRSSRDTSAADLKFLNPRGEFFQERQIEKRH